MFTLSISPPILNLTLGISLDQFTEQGYLPQIDLKQYWLRTKDYIPLEDITESKPTNITLMFYPYWYYKAFMES